MPKEEQFVIKFDYNIDLINKLVADAKAVDVSNIESVKDYHKQLVKVRTTIKKQESEMVEVANKFRKNVFAKRDEYLGLTEPIEASLKVILDADESRKVLEARSTLLPMKKQQLSMLEVTALSDREILEMDEERWVAYYTECTKIHSDRQEAKKRAITEAKERQEREEKIKKDAEDRAEKEKVEALRRAEEDKANALKKAEADKIKAVEDAKKEIELKALRDKQELEAKARKEKLDQEKLESQKSYQKFLTDNGYTEETKSDFLIQRNGSEVILFKKVAQIKL